MKPSDSSSVRRTRNLRGYEAMHAHLTVFVIMLKKTPKPELVRRSGRGLARRKSK